MNWQVFILIAGKVIKVLLCAEFKEVVTKTRLFCATVKNAWADHQITYAEITDIVKSADGLSDAIKELIKAQANAT